MTSEKNICSRALLRNYVKRYSLNGFLKTAIINIGSKTMSSEFTVKNISGKITLSNLNFSNGTLVIPNLKTFIAIVNSFVSIHKDVDVEFEYSKVRSNDNSIEKLTMTNDNRSIIFTGAIASIIKPKEPKAPTEDFDAIVPLEVNTIRDLKKVIIASKNHKRCHVILTFEKTNVIFRIEDGFGTSFSLRLNPTLFNQFPSQQFSFFLVKKVLGSVTTKLKSGSLQISKEGFLKFIFHEEAFELEYIISNRDTD